MQRPNHLLPLVHGTAAVERSGKVKGYMYAFTFTKGTYEEIARVRHAKGLEIQLVTMRELLSERADLVTPVPTGELFPVEESPTDTARTGRASGR